MALININIEKDIEISKLKILNYYIVLYAFSKLLVLKLFRPILFPR